MLCGATIVILEEAKTVDLSFGMEIDEMQDSTEFSTKLFDKLD
jgi:hypothetical protein